MECPRCRLLNPPTAKYCDCGWTLTTPVPRHPVRNTIGVLAIITLFVAGYVEWVTDTHPWPVRSTTTPAGDGRTLSKDSPDKHITDERFRKVREAFEKVGARVERDPTAPDTVRVYLPWSAASDMSERGAKEMARDARDRLGTDAIVYIKTPSGQTIGKAAPWD